MADLITGYRRIISDRKFEDYKSMKTYFSSRFHATKEIIFEGYQLATAGAGVVIDGAQHTVGALITSEEVAYIATEVDDANQDAKKVWVVYQDILGVIHGPIEHLIAAPGVGTTATVHCLGNENVIDTAASGEGTDQCVLTGLNPGLDAYNGLYLVCYSGDQKGDVHLITGTSADNPTHLTITPNGGAALDTGLVSIQEFPCEDFFRVREMYCEVEPLDTKQIVLGTHDVGTVYNAIGCDARYSAHSGYFSPDAATCRSFLGKIKATHSIDSTVTEITGGSVFVTYTPIAANTNGDSADITVELTFSNNLEWEPCIELEPATDVIIKISNVEGAKLSEMFVEVTYLEAYGNL